MYDLSVKHPNWLADVAEVEEFPRGNGTIIEQIIFKGSRPQIERGWAQWRTLANNTGCADGQGPDGNYNWTTWGGYGFERKVAQLMSRDFRTPDYNVNEIQTTAQFKEVVAKVIENIFAQRDFFREFSIGQNALTGLAKKYVIDSSGPRYNTANIYAYAPTGSATLSALNITLLEFFYEQMRRAPSTIPYDVIDGSPVFALECSHQLLSHLYRDDPNLRQDVRFSGLANDNLTKYNFMSTIRGMYVAAPILYPRRFNRVGGIPVEILPFVNNIPAEVGSYTDINPAYEAATHEEVLIHGKNPFKMFYLPTEASLGNNMTFGPEPSFLDTWLWVNPATDCDPFRRTGFFASSIKVAIAPQFSDGIFGILVERPSRQLMFMPNPSPTCPTTPVDCGNTIPVQDCPCPVVASVVQNPLHPTRWFFTFFLPITGVDGGTVTFSLDNGGQISGTLFGAVDASLVAEITMPASFDGATAGITTISCDSVATCSATVVCAPDCRSGETNQIVLTLSNPIVADTASDIIYACFGDGIVQHLSVISVDQVNLKWTVEYAAGYGPTDDPTGAGDTNLNADMICDRGGILKVCVPPATDATCPSCDSSVTTCSGAQS
jgi:hypothetical protein